MGEPSMQTVDVEALDNSIARCADHAHAPEMSRPREASGAATASEQELRPRLEVVVPTYNRPAKLHRLLASGLALAVPGMRFVVIDDCSTVCEEVPGIGLASTEEVCASFDTDRVTYLRNERNVGVAASWQRYYRDLCKAEYASTMTDKDEFIDPAPIVSALGKLDTDPGLAMVVLPLRQNDRLMEDRGLLFDYPTMSGRDYLARYVQDSRLQHCSMYSIVRVEAIRAAGVPRPLGLRRWDLDDGFGTDIDFVFNVATTGDVAFERDAHIRRSTLAGGTERYPLTFAYTYYQYAKRAMRELRARGFVTRETARRYLSLWILLICRGLLVAYRPVHGTELEPGTERIRRHLRMPIHLYLVVECIRHRIRPTREMTSLFWTTAKLVLKNRRARPGARPASAERDA